jgi:hypothetical protein
MIRDLMFGSSIHTDTEWPKDPEAKMNADGLIEPSCECFVSALAFVARLIINAT